MDMKEWNDREEDRKRKLLDLLLEELFDRGFLTREEMNHMCDVNDNRGRKKQVR